MAVSYVTAKSSQHYSPSLSNRCATRHPTQAQLFPHPTHVVHTADCASTTEDHRKKLLPPPTKLSAAGPLPAYHSNTKSTVRLAIASIALVAVKPSQPVLCALCTGCHQRGDQAQFHYFCTSGIGHMAAHSATHTSDL